jgi:SAM-dependent methyltransferase
MTVLPDSVAERLHVTSLRAERMAVAVRALRGRCLDVGAGDNCFLRLYARMANELGVSPELAAESIGVDIIDWGGGTQTIKSADALPFPDGSFDSVSFIACLNHIPERRSALIEAKRILRPGGRLVITMISRIVGTVGHAIWWYSEDKHREVDQHEAMGLDHAEVLDLITQAGFGTPHVQSFFYGFNRLYIAETK